ncbi:hypothetical protein ACOME3_006782 [Neoechinorhynchus agilis]
MLGYDVSFGAFSSIQLLSSSSIEHKRCAYLSLSKIFSVSLAPSIGELLVLTTNSIKKDLNSGNQFICGFALQALGTILNSELAQSLTTDVINLLSSSKPILRKKAVVLLRKLLTLNPSATADALPRLIDRLMMDNDVGVQTAIITVLCELSVDNGQFLTPLIPTLLPLISTTKNNWLMIKLIKLLSQLVPFEKTLANNLIDPLTAIIQGTSATSLLYECINTIIVVLISMSEDDGHASAVSLCAQKISVLIDDKDQNLRYLGLQTLAKVLNDTQKKARCQGSHRRLVLKCLNDPDESIRRRAIDLLSE